MLATCIFAAAAINSFAQPKQNCNWKDRMKSEFIAFLTDELSLTPEESQTFWPVYNQLSEKRFQANGKLMKAVKQVHQAVETGEGNYAALMDAYMKAYKEKEKVESDYIASLRKEFGDEKAAKLIVAEEKFRRNQIHRLGGSCKPGEQKPGEARSGAQKPGMHSGGRPGPDEHGPYRARE